MIETAPPPVRHGRWREVLRRQFWWFAATFGTVVGVTTYVTMRQQAVYGARVTLRLEEERGGGGVDHRQTACTIVDRRRRHRLPAEGQAGVNAGIEQREHTYGFLPIQSPGPLGQRLDQGPGHPRGILQRVPVSFGDVEDVREVP